VSAAADAPALAPGFGAHTFGAFNVARAELPASCEQMWALLLDRAPWMPGFAGKATIDGEQGAAGERAQFSSRGDDGSVHTRLEEVLHLELHRRMVLRLETLAEAATTAFVDWRLQPLPAGCLLELNLFWLDLPQPGMDWPATRALREGYIAATQAVIEGHLVRLRQALARP
jgi:hypothetical protein